MHRDEQALFSYLQYRACPAAFAGKAFGIMGAAVEGRLDSGHVVGSVSGHLYQSLPRSIRSRFVVPPEVLGIADYELKYLTILQLAGSQTTRMSGSSPARRLTVAHASRDILAAQEGAFGTLLLERDICDPSLTFGAGGVLDVAASPALERPGFGLAACTV